MLTIGNAPLSWGVFEADADTNPPWSIVLDEIAAAGYSGTELGPIGFLPEGTDILRAELDKRGLTLTGGFVYEHLHDPAWHDAVIGSTTRVVRVLSELGARYLVVIDRMFMERQQTAGRSDKAQRLTGDAWMYLMDTIREVSSIAQSHNIRPVLHPHAGTHIEFIDEIDRALTDLSHEAIGLCIDTGHSAVAGLQAADLVAQYPERVEYFHLKDVSAHGMRRMITEDLAFEEALGKGLFCPLGNGVVDFSALHLSLAKIGFDGIATVEQDPDPYANTPHTGLDSAKQSLAYLRAVGLCEATSGATEPGDGHPKGQTT
ncbi:sugar phosphate isomerase/epimerase family protein [Candidatus Protofrankia californiensis]|uniref:sugar phosphate isomerase/epimerase family protein n=1 Tax=Candidatus Protofrankia californiensis TaxID=1839754 RepID=UPI001040E4DD|nr:sugar phosphate isomerase/epimerase [Candidatus Protofrankia californiensis]